MIRKNKQLNGLFLLVVGIFIMGTFVFPFSPQVASGYGNYFGGKVTSTAPCTCGGGHQVVISGGKNPGNYFLPPGSRVYDRGWVSSGRNTIGSYTPGGSCSYYVGNTCEKRQIDSTINMIGVSF